MVGRVEHKRVVDKSGFRAYSVDVDWGVNFPSVTHFVTALKECKTFLDDVVSGNFMFSREDVQRFASWIIHEARDSGNHNQLMLSSFSHDESARRLAGAIVQAAFGRSATVPDLLCRTGSGGGHRL